MARGHARIGLSGWNYPAWKDTFYAGIRRADWLTYAASRFTTIEVNATFYRSQKPATYARWHDATPDDFVFAVKGHRVVTHRLRLKDAGDAIGRQRAELQLLAKKLGAVLWQLPGSFAADPETLANFLDALQAWPDVPHAIEFRHRSWFGTGTAEALTGAGVAVCISDAGSWPRWDRVTAPLVYVRLHGAPVTYVSAYDGRTLRGWTRRIRRWQAEGRDVLVFFDNDAEGAAFEDAARLAEMVGRPTRP